MGFVSTQWPNKTLHTNRRPALDFGLSIGLFNTGRPHHVIVRAAVGELVRRRRTRLGFLRASVSLWLFFPPLRHRGHRELCGSSGARISFRVFREVRSAGDRGCVRLDVLSARTSSPVGASARIPRPRNLHHRALSYERYRGDFL